MTFNPLQEKGISLEKQVRSWHDIVKRPFDKHKVCCYTRTRQILMNGIEIEQWNFKHNFARKTDDKDTLEFLARTKRIEDAQQTTINWLAPCDQSVLETTLGYEQVAVDLTAWLAQNEPDKYVKETDDKTPTLIASTASPYKFSKSVLKAVDNINTIIRKELIGQKLDQVNVDKTLLKLDGTNNKSKLGANAMLAVSLASLKCLAKLQNKELYEYVTYGKVSLPIPMINIVNGGVHADNNLDIQEFMIVPIMKGEKERIRAASEVFHTLKDILKKKGYATSVGDEGGFAPNLQNTSEALDLIMDAINVANYHPGKDILIALDVAASELYDKDTNILYYYKLDT